MLALAHEPEARQAQLLGVKTRAPSAADWLTAEHVIAALQLVAARLGADSLTTGEYRAERARLLAGDRARWLHGRWLLIPDDEQVIAAAGSWDAALGLAELKTPAERGPSRQPAAPTLVDLLERFHDAHGFQPSARELRAFARGNGVPYPSERAQRFGAAVVEWRSQRREAGLPQPRVVTRAGGRGHKAPDYSANVGAGRTGEQRRAKWTRASCAAAVAHYLAQLPTGERSTERGYADWAATQPRGATPAMSTILALGGWEAARRAAQEHHGRIVGRILFRHCELNSLMAAPPKGQIIAEGKRALDLLEDGSYSNERVFRELVTLLEAVKAGALAISAERVETRLPDEVGKLEDAVSPLQSALEEYETEGTAIDAKLVEDFSAALVDAEKSRG